MTTQQFINKFKWVKDRRDSWRILDTAPYAGDCDDFATTVLWLECGRSLWKFWWMLTSFQAVMWLCKGPSGAQHVVLWMRGRGWIDNTAPKWALRCSCPKISPLPLPVVAAKMALARLPIYNRTE